MGEVTGGALEDRFDDTGPYFRRLAQDPLHREEFVDILGPDIAGPGLFREIDEPDIDLWFFAVLDPDQLVVPDSVPDVLENFTRAVEKFVCKGDPGLPEPLDVPVIDIERPLVGVLARDLAELFLVLALQEPAPVADPV